MSTCKEQWVVFDNGQGKILAIEDLHNGEYGMLKEKGYKILGTPLAPNAAEAIRYVQAYINT